MSPMPKPKSERPLEARVKQDIRDLLAKHQWFWWNVPMNTYAKSGISDIHAVKLGMFMAIEGKREAKDMPTGLQKAFLQSIAAEQHFAFVVDSSTLPVFQLFLECLDRSIAATSRREKPTIEDGAGMLDCIKELTRKWI